MSEVSKPKARKIQGERIALNLESSRRVNQWLATLKEKYPGLRMRRSDLVDWLVSHRPAALSEEEISHVGERFYDQMQLAQWMVRQLKEAKASGKEVSLDELVKGVQKGGL